MIGVTLNSYKIVKKISEGGMGEIYLAEHKFLERKAAVKVLHKSYSSNKDVRQRFIQEAQTLSKLDHPYIVKIFDFDQYQDVFYIIMEYISGYTLEQYTRIKNGLMPEHIAKEFFTKVLTAVNYAHINQVVHRDIKPSNIMIDDQNDPKILDFGIARLLDSDQRVTKVNTKMGSILYMSPEQILGKDVDLRSDIYSLGITIYETLTAKHPYDFEEDSDYTLQSKIINDYPPPPSAYYPMITKQMECVISTAINKEPLRRFNSCSDFSEAINDPYYTGDYLYSDEIVVLPEIQYTKKNGLDVNNSANENDINEDKYSNIGDQRKPENEDFSKFKESKTKISENNINEGVAEIPIKKNKPEMIQVPIQQNSRKYYSSPIFYISILLIVFIGFALFFYNLNKEANDTTIIKVDTTIQKTPQPKPVIKDEKEDDKIVDPKVKSNPIIKKNPKKKQSSTKTNNDYIPPTKKGSTSFE